MTWTDLRLAPVLTRTGGLVRVLQHRRLEVGWVVFALANLALMTRWMQWQTVPFHLIYFSLTIVYGLRVWPLRLTTVVLGIVMTSTGSLIAANQLTGGDWGELVEVPLMTAMVCAMVWHARRRERASVAYEGKSRQLELVISITAAANEAATMDDLLRASLAELCELGGWPVGQVWMPSETRPGELTPTETWHCGDPERFAALRAATLTESLAHGEGLPGHALATRSSQWSRDEPLTRGRSDGVASAFAIPVTDDQITVAVLEFLSLDANPPEPDLLDLLSHIGDQLGHVVRRTRSESELRAAEEQYARSSRRCRSRLTSTLQTRCRASSGSASRSARSPRTPATSGSPTRVSSRGSSTPTTASACSRRSRE